LGGAKELAAEMALKLLRNDGDAYLHLSNPRQQHYDDVPSRSLLHSNIPDKQCSEGRSDGNSNIPSPSDFFSNAQHSPLSHTNIFSDVEGDQMQGHYDDTPPQCSDLSDIPPDHSERKSDDNTDNPSPSGFFSNAQYSCFSHSLLNNVGGNQMNAHSEYMSL
jgi:hypothetical protein